MDQKNLDTAMEIFALLITGEEVGGDAHPELYEAYRSQAGVYDLLDTMMKKANLELFDYKGSLFVSAGDQNKIFGYSNDELKKAMGLRLNKELFLAYLIIYDIMMLFYETTASDASFDYVKSETVIESVTSLVGGVLSALPALSMSELEESSFKTIALLWDELPLVTDNEDLSTLKAARGSKTGFVKLVFNFLISQKLFVAAGGRYYITRRMQALITGYYDHHKGRLYEMIAASAGKNEEDDEHASY